MTHREIMELLPWYANATLEEEERLEVEKHVEACRECALEVEQFKAVQAAMVEVGEEAPSPSPFGIHKALAQIEEYEQQRRRGWLRSLLGFAEGAWSGWWSPAPVFARVVIVTQLFVILGLCGFFLLRPEAGHEFTTLTGPPATRGGSLLSVGFEVGVSEETMRNVIAGIRGNIVAGPSALGLYTIEVPVSPDRREEIDRLLEGLRQNRSVVRFAELQP